MADSRSGAIPSDITLSTSQAIRRNAANDGFEAFTVGEGSGTTVEVTVAQNTHGLSVGDIIKSSGSANAFAKAKADSSANAEVVGIVSVVTDANNFKYVSHGYITTGVPTATAGTVYFLDPSTAGALTATEPTTAGQVSKPVLVVLESAAKAQVINMRGMEITTESDYNGWVSAGETWTYASADDPSFTFTITGDKTTKYSAGMRILLTQTTAKYFIITKVAYSSPNTTITVYGGTDYDLADAAITSPYYSVMKAPYGFPLEPTKWSVITSSSSERTTTTPTNGTWYNAESLSIPIGSWSVSYQCNLGTNNNSSDLDAFCTLSTANNSDSDSDFRGNTQLTTASYIQASIFKQKVLNLTAKTTYYLNYTTNRDSVEAIGIYGNREVTIIRSICAYL
jgi:hypothetical protein